MHRLGNQNTCFLLLYPTINRRRCFIRQRRRRATVQYVVVEVPPEARRLVRRERQNVVRDVHARVCCRFPVFFRLTIARREEVYWTPSIAERSIVEWT